MKTLARHTPAVAPVLDYAVIIEETDGGFLVQGQEGAYPARRAAGCLLEPQPGDLVLLSLDAEGLCYVLSVLESEGRSARMTFPGDVTLAAPDGSVTVAAGEGVSLSGRRFSLRAEEGEARVGIMSLIGRFWHGQFERAKAVGHSLDVIFHDLVSRLHSSYRYIEEHEEIQAESMRCLVDGVLTIQTQNTVHTAEEHIKLDADQIHLA